jgi:Fe-S cluster biogenesis protein NfuA
MTCCKNDELHVSMVRLPTLALTGGPTVPSDEDQITTAEGGAATVVDDAERERRTAALDALLDLMKPAVQADGGELVLTNLDVDRGIVEVQLQGACGSCAISGATLQGGVERLLRQRLEWVTEVRGSVDESMELSESVSLGRGGYVPRY